MPDKPPFSIGDPSPGMISELKREEYQKGIELLTKSGGLLNDAETAKIVMDGLLMLEGVEDYEQHVHDFLEDGNIVLSDQDFFELVRCTRAVNIIDKKTN